MSLWSLERIRKRKNEDEEMMFVILPALHLHLMDSTYPRIREKRHSSFLYGNERVRYLLGGHLKNCLTAFRMEPHIFMWLASYLRDDGLISDSRIKVEEKLAFFLYMLSHNASYEKLQIEFQHSGWSFSKYIRELYHRHTAEGNFNFTSTAEKFMKPDVTDIESDDDEREMIKQKVVDEKDEDLQMLDQSEVEQVRADQRKAEVEHVKVNQRKVAGPSTSKPYKPKHSPKKSSGDGLVSVMERFVKIKENEANLEATQDFSITKCIAALRNLEGFDSSEKPKAFAVFKTVENREIFLSAMDDKDGSALVWLRIEMDKLA